MSHEINQLWQCNFCSARFPSSDLLQRHFDEYRARAADAENCRAHANANANDSSEDRLADDEKLETIRKNSKCPYKGCDRSEPFQKGQQLRVHFRRHVICEEVYVFCFKVFRVASEYIRHTRDHGDTVEEKAAYTNRRTARLVKQSNQELLAQLRVNGHHRAKKRTWTESSLHSDVANSNLKCGGIRILGRNSSFDSVNQPISPPYIFTGAGLTSILVPDIIEQLDFANTTADLQPQTDVLLPAQEDDDIYTPSLFLRMNFCRYPPSADLGLGLENVADIKTAALQYTI